MNCERHFYENHNALRNLSLHLSEEERETNARKAAARQKYRESAKGKAAQAEAYKRYRKSEKGREARKRNR